MLGRMQPFDSVTILEHAEPLDPVVERVRAIVGKALRPRALRNALHGVWLGHPLHPTLVQVSVGALMSASVLDLVPGNERASQALVATGLASAGPSAVTGWADWSELHEEQQRVGLVHAALNVAGLAAYALSLAARVSGRQRSGTVLGLAGLSLISGGGFLGGHLSFRQAAGANHAEDVPHLVGPGWHDLCAVDDLPPDGKPTRFVLEGASGDVPLVLVRQAGRIDVLSDRCSHLSGPLSEGSLTHGGQCITCPWHGSAFLLDDGSVRQGPATAPVPAFDVKVEDGRLRVRLPGAH
jgi:nitrite reductase/ring-hydroxylating ferredoxin subunit